jgi:DNA processing protein
MNIPSLMLLSLVPNLGPVRVRSLVAAFGNPEAVLLATPAELATVDGIGTETARKIAATGKDLALQTAFAKTIDHQLQLAEKHQVQIVSFWDDDYPAELRQLYDAPLYFFLKGKIEEQDKYSISVVGTRTPSDYGRNAAEKLVRGLAELNLTIVSGLARGIDTVAHKAALDAGSRTIAVLGSGIDKIYPAENTKLAGRILERGCILSEEFFEQPPDKNNFPKRNRIIAALTLGTLIIESDDKGGSMITARYALDQNKEVFALPGSIYSKKSTGTNRLIKESKAKLVQSVDDIILELEAKLRPVVVKSSEVEKAVDIELSGDEQKIYDAIRSEPTHIDEICETSGLEVSDALVLLFELEFKNVVRQLAGKLFEKV